MMLAMKSEWIPLKASSPRMLETSAGLYQTQNALITREALDG